MKDRSVLLIEDSKLHQTLVERALHEGNYALSTAKTGIEGLSQLSKKKFDLVIVDLALPDLNGLSVVRTVREMTGHSEIPIVIFSSTPEAELSSELDEFNISAYIEKGAFQASTFLETLDGIFKQPQMPSNVQVLFLNSPREIKTDLEQLVSEESFNFVFLEDFNQLRLQITTETPDVIAFYCAQSDQNAYKEIRRHYETSALQGIPWVLLFNGQIPSNATSLIERRQILPIALPTNELFFKKALELAAQMRQANISTEEYSLELEIALAELEKKRGSLARAKSEIAQRKKNFGDTLLKIGKEVRRPLTTILGFTEGLRKHNQDQDTREVIDTIHNNGKYLAQIVDDVLSIAAIEKGHFSVKKRWFDLLPTINDLVENTKERAQAVGISFNVRFEGELPTEIESDATLIKQMLSGLIDNALKFTEQGSIQLCVRYNQTNNKLLLSVVDTGPGISPERVPQLFDGVVGLGSTISLLGSGSGLGLAYVKFAVEQLEGEITVESEPNKGSTFTISLDPGPVKDTFSPELADTIIELGAHSSITNPLDLQGSVLIGHTQLESRKLFTFLLDKTNIQYAFAESSNDAVELAQQGDFDMILADVVAGDTEGFTVVRNLRKLGFTKPIISVSACTFDEQRQRCLEAGCSAVLDKPFRVDKFYELLAQHLPQKRTESEQSTGLFEKSSASEQATDLPLPEVILPDLSRTDTAARSMVVEFLDCLPSHVDLLKENLKSRNWKALLEGALELKSAADVFGYPQLKENADKLQKSIEQKNSDEARFLLKLTTSLLSAMLAGKDQLVEPDSKEPTFVPEAVRDGVHELFSAAEALVPDESALPFTPTVNLEQSKADRKSSPVNDLQADLSKRLEQLNRAIGTGDWKVAGDIANELSETAAMFGLQKLSHKLVHLESICNLQNRSAATDALAEVGAFAEGLAEEQPAEDPSDEEDSFFQNVIEQFSDLYFSDKPSESESTEKTSSPEIAQTEAEDLQPALLPPAEEKEPSETKLKREPVSKIVPADPFAETITNSLLDAEPEAPEVEETLEASEEREEIEEKELEIVEPRDTIPLEESETSPGLSATQDSPEFPEIIESDLIKMEPSTAPLVLDFLNELKDLIESLQTAFDKKDWSSIQDIAEEVYGSAGICGYEMCAEAAKNLKSAVNDGEEELVSVFHADFQQICAAMLRGRERLFQ